MPASNPLIDGAPVFVPNQAPASIAPYDQSGGQGVNGNDTNASGTQEALAQHVAAVIVLALAGVVLLRWSGFTFVGAARVGVGS